MKITNTPEGIQYIVYAKVYLVMRGMRQKNNLCPCKPFSILLNKHKKIEF